MLNHRRRLAIGVIAIALLSGCTSQGSEATDGQTQGATTSATSDGEEPNVNEGHEDGDPSTAALTPGEPGPEWREVTLGGVTLAVPDGFQAVEGVPTRDERTSSYLLRYGDEDGARAAITIGVDTAPAVNAEQAVDGQIEVERAQLGIENEQTAELSWPGTEVAHHLTYEQDVLLVQGEAPVRHRAEWVYADLPDGTQVGIGVLAPPDLYEELDLHAVLATWRPAG